MESFVWKESFSIGIGDIDHQHKIFLGYLNDCYLQVSGGRKAQISPAIFNRLKAYAATHFSFEEELMLSNGYPELDVHKQQHRYFDAQVLELEAALLSEGEKSAESLLAFLRDWYLKHILEQDKRYAPYIKQ